MLCLVLRSQRPRLIIPRVNTRTVRFVRCFYRRETKRNSPRIRYAAHQTANSKDTNSKDVRRSNHYIHTFFSLFRRCRFSSSCPSVLRRVDARTAIADGDSGVFGVSPPPLPWTSFPTALPFAAPAAAAAASPAGCDRTVSCRSCRCGCLHRSWTARSSCFFIFLRRRHTGFERRVVEPSPARLSPSATMILGRVEIGINNILIVVCS